MSGKISGFQQFVVTLTLGFIIVFTTKSLPQESQIVPWDTVIATIKMIESADLNDSLRSGAIGHLFLQHNIDSLAYAGFYQQMMSSPQSDQKAFLDKVKAILTDFSSLSRTANPSGEKVIKPQKTPLSVPPNP